MDRQEALHLSSPGAHYALTYIPGRLRFIGAMELLIGNWWDVYMEVDTIEDGAREFFSILQDTCLWTRALFGRMSEIATGTGIARCQQEKARGEYDRTCCT